MNFTSGIFSIVKHSCLYNKKELGNGPLSRGSQFVSGDFIRKSFVYARLASFSLQDYLCINKAF